MSVSVIFKKGQSISRDLRFQLKHLCLCFPAHLKSHLRLLFKQIFVSIFFFVNRSGQIKPEKHSCHPENATKHSMQRKIFLKFKFEKRAIKMCPSRLRFLNVLKGTCFFSSHFLFFFPLTKSSSL